MPHLHYKVEPNWYASKGTLDTLLSLNVDTLIDTLLNGTSDNACGNTIIEAELLFHRNLQESG